MFDWLFEGRLPVLLLLLLLAGVLAFMWRNVGDRRLLTAAGVFLFLALLYCLLNFFVETDREQISRKLDEMNAALNKPDLDAVFGHVSESFRFREADKKATLQRAKDAFSTYRIKSVRIWDIGVGEVDRDRKKAKVTFSAQAESSIDTGPRPHIECRSEWVLDPDGQWRMQKLELKMAGTDQPLQF